MFLIMIIEERPATLQKGCGTFFYSQLSLPINERNVSRVLLKVSFISQFPQIRYKYRGTSRIIYNAGNETPRRNLIISGSGVKRGTSLNSYNSDNGGIPAKGKNSRNLIVEMSRDL